MKAWNIERATFVFLVAGVGFFVLAFVGLGLAPWAEVDGETATKAPKELTPLTPLQMAGRKSYIKNGCGYCHSQFVRQVGDDPLRYGPSSKAWEYSQQYPQLFGTRRIGPDLTREGGVHSDRWQYVHLYKPRMIVPWSIMPSFPWLFDGSPEKPSHEAKALVAYLQTLGKARQAHMQASGEASKRFIPGIGPVLEYSYHGGKLADPGYDKVVYFKKAKRPEDTSNLRRRGGRLFRGQCMKCHGAQGFADGPAARYLKPTPVRLASFRFDPQFLYKVLYFGRPGTAMPSFVHSFDSFLAPRDLWALTDYMTSPGFYKGDDGISAVQAPEPPPKTAALMKLGEDTFSTQCSACHGARGGGDGPAASALSPAPVNFRGMQPSVRWAYHVITEGRAGTSMPPFASLKAKTRWALAYFIRSLFEGDTPTNAVAVDSARRESEHHNAATAPHTRRHRAHANEQRS